MTPFSVLALVTSFDLVFGEGFRCEHCSAALGIVFDEMIAGGTKYMFLIVNIGFNGYFCSIITK